jgi:radical S-adenosyl methionine domain-containing protein 2
MDIKRTPALPLIIDLEILGACDLTCPFCYGPRHTKGPTNIPALLDLIDRFPRYGVQSIVITGGEPCLVKELPAILAAAKQVGLKTVLSTNGLRFSKRIDDLAPLLDWVALPLDAADATNNARMRTGNSRQFEVVTTLFPIIRARYPDLKIKLGTVVCAINRDQAPDMIGMVRELRPDVWKLYQVAYSVYAEDNRAMLELSDGQFEEIYQTVARQAQRHDIQLAKYTRAERDGKHLFLTPEGDAMVIARGKELRIGNFYHDLDQVARTWYEYVLPDRMNANFAATYPEEASVHKALHTSLAS